MTDFEKYFTQIYDGRIIACEKMKMLSERLLNQYVSPEQYHFDEALANHHIGFIEQYCKQPTGKLGTPLRLELFQKARLQALFGFVDDNNLRQYNECLTIEGRKNGKTTECAAVEIDMACNDREGAPQVYNIATMLEQAKLGFNACHKMIRQSPVLKKYIRKRANDLYCDFNFGFIKALASNTTSLDGLDTHCAVIDELAAIKNRDIYDLIKQSMGARTQPLLFCITTNGFVRNGIFDAQYDYAKAVIEGKVKDDHFLPFIYELDNIDEWDKPECWIKANPGLGTIKSYDYMEQIVAKAKADPSFKPTVLVKDFNMVQTNEAAYLRFEEINNEKVSDEHFKYCIGGFDAADSIDLNAAVAVCQKPDSNEIVVRSMFWLPEEQVERDGRVERDYVPYRQWASEGKLRLCPGNKCDKRIFLDWFLELREKEKLYPLYIGYDPWHISDDLLAQFKMSFGAQCMVPVRQGVFSMSEPMKEIKAEFQAHNIVYQNNPILKWCLMNLHAKRDVNNNVQPVKGDSPLKRIDGAVALIIAYKVLLDKKETYIYLNKERKHDNTEEPSGAAED
jgi:phage terminase large subunit-like protein